MAEVDPCLAGRGRDQSLDQHLGAWRWSELGMGSDLGPRKPEREQVSQPTRNCGPFGRLTGTTAWPGGMGHGRGHKEGRERNTAAETAADPRRRRHLDLGSRKNS